MFKNKKERCNSRNRAIKLNEENKLWGLGFIGVVSTIKKTKFNFVAINHYNKWVEARTLNSKYMAEVARFMEEFIVKNMELIKWHI